MIDKQAIGLAGELRVMSELMLRGHNPAKSYLDTGVDIILENGIKIQVKTSLIKSKNNRSMSYRFGWAKGEKRTGNNLSDCVDFLIGFIPKENVFFIIPTGEIKNIYMISVTMKKDMKGKYTKYINRWDLLKKGL